MSKRNVHVVQRENGWAVVKEKAERDSSHHRTQADAIEAGKKAAQSERSELVIHGRDGKIRDKDSFGHDPFPPRDIKH